MTVKKNDTPSETPATASLPLRKKGIYMLPNMITLAALFGGFYAVVMSMNGRFDLATLGIFAAMFLDGLDGRVARLTNTQSAFGEQMDSLSDMVSFGAAPALIAYEWTLRDLGRWGWIAAFVYVSCAALRLARFNVNTSVVDKRYFQGLPSPAAAALVATSSSRSGSSSSSSSAIATPWASALSSSSSLMTRSMSTLKSSAMVDSSTNSDVKPWKINLLYDGKCSLCMKVC